jgi:hypothetical protein
VKCCFYVFNFICIVFIYLFIYFIYFIFYFIYLFIFWSHSVNVHIQFEITVTVLNLHNNSFSMDIWLERLMIICIFYVLMIKGPHLHTMDRFYMYKEIKVIIYTKNIQPAPVQSSISFHSTHLSLGWLCNIRHPALLLRHKVKAVFQYLWRL